MGVQSDIFKVFSTEIGSRIRKKRIQQKLSLEKLGLEVGLTRQQIHRIENGYNITLKTILKISIALNMRPEALLKTKIKFKKEDLERLVNSNKASKAK